jgi:hypothetical protein
MFSLFLHKPCIHTDAMFIASFIINVWAKRRWMFNINPDCFIPGIEPWYPLNRSLLEPKNLFGSFRNRDVPACSLYTVPTEQHAIRLVPVHVILWDGWLSRYSDWLRAGRCGDRIPVGARISATVQTGPGPTEPLVQ